MQYQAHRGVTTEFPENTLPAFLAAIKQGYDYIELDPAFTKDGVCVAFHDSTLNRVCRNADGGRIEKEIKLLDITYADALKYDVCDFKSRKFRNVKIPLFSDCLKLAEKSNVKIKIDNRLQHFSSVEQQTVFRIVEEHTANVVFTVSDIEFLKVLVARFPNFEIHYDGYVDESTLKTVKNILRDNPLTVWLSLQSPDTAWVIYPKADAELCRLIKKFGKLGLWILKNQEQLEIAEKFGADIIETTGALKPERKICGFVDCHTHSHYSHDSECEISSTAKAAEDKKIFGFAVTDHCDIEFSDGVDYLSPIIKSAREAKEYGGFAGVEIGGMLWYPEKALAVAGAYPFDIVLGSVHTVKMPETAWRTARCDYSKLDAKKIDEFLRVYFSNIKEMLEIGDFDVLTHLTYPLRYICGKHGIKVDISRYYSVIEEILEMLVTKGIALEVNTSGIDTDYDRLMPDIEILKIYKKVGGYLITLGSDAHKFGRLANGFEQTAKLLKKVGFSDLYYYDCRIPIQYRI